MIEGIEGGLEDRGAKRIEGAQRGESNEIGWWYKGGRKEKEIFYPMVCRG